MLVGPQRFEGGIVLVDGLACNPKEFSALPNPGAHDVFAFAVVVVGGQVSAQVGAAVADFGAGEHQLCRLIQSGRIADLTESC